MALGCSCPQDRGWAFSQNREAVAQDPQETDMSTPCCVGSEHGPDGPSAGQGTCPVHWQLWSWQSRGEISPRGEIFSTFYRTKLALRSHSPVATLLARMENTFATFEKQKKIRMGPGVMLVSNRQFSRLYVPNIQMNEWIDRNALFLGPVRSLNLS